MHAGNDPDMFVLSIFMQAMQKNLFHLLLPSIPCVSLSAEIAVNCSYFYTAAFLKVYNIAGIDRERCGERQEREARL